MHRLALRTHRETGQRRKILAQLKWLSFVNFRQFLNRNHSTDLFHDATGELHIGLSGFMNFPND
jgi:hypothetical protein